MATICARLPRLLLLLLLTLPVAGCDLIGGIFQAGFVTAIFFIVVIVAIVGFVVRGRRRP